MSEENGESESISIGYNQKHDKEDQKKHYKAIYNISESQDIVKPNQFISYLLCRECFRCPRVKINNDISYNLTCFCHKVKKVNFEYILKNYTIKEMNETQINNSNKASEEKESVLKIFSQLDCEYHPEQKYFAYCFTCNSNICHECMGNLNQHRNHEYENFDKSVIDEEFANIIKFKEYGNIENSIIKQKKNDFKEINNLYFVINLIKKTFDTYPCYNSYLSIKKISVFIDRLKTNKINNQTQILEKVRKINSLKKVNELNIYTIEINKFNFNDIRILENKNFNNLKKISLSNNHISDIKPLTTISAPLLSWIDLTINDIDDESSIEEIIKKFDRLVFLNLYDNKFKDPKIFSYFEEKKRKNLTKFYIGKNIFENEKLNNQIQKYKMPFIEEIGLGGGAFDDSTIKIISLFEFTNLIIIHLSENGLHSLDFVNYLECKKLEQFIARDNNISDYKPLKKFRRLKIINLNNNPIDNINDLEKFVEALPLLEKFFLENTKINSNESETSIITKKIKEEYETLIFY